MEATERRCFEGGVRACHLRPHDGAALDSALRESGMARRCSAVDRPTAVSVLSRRRERRRPPRPHSIGCWRPPSASTRRGVDGAEVGQSSSRRSSRGDAPGRLDGDWCVVEGLGTAALGRGDTALVVARTPDGAATFAVELGLLRAGRCWASIRRSGCSKSWGTRDSVGGAAHGRRLAGRGRPGTTRDSGTSWSVPEGRCSSWRGRTPWNGCSSGVRSGASRPSATVWPRAWSPSRRPPPC